MLPKGPISPKMPIFQADFEEPRVEERNGRGI